MTDHDVIGTSIQCDRSELERLNKLPPNCNEAQILASKMILEQPMLHTGGPGDQGSVTNSSDVGTPNDGVHQSDSEQNLDSVRFQHSLVMPSPDADADSVAYSTSYVSEFNPNDSLTLHSSFFMHDRRDLILPRTNPKSPFYTTVPIPKQVKLVTNKSSTVHEEDEELDAESGAEEGGYTEDDIYDSENMFVKEYPTVLLADRFYKWKKILKQINAYLKEAAYAQEEFARINIQMKTAVKFKFLTDISDESNAIIDPFVAKRPTRKQPATLAEQKKMSEQGFDPEAANLPTPGAENYMQNLSSPLAASGFMKFGSGSIQDLQVVLKKYHLSMANQQFKVSKEITTHMIPKLEALRKDLTVKIKDIKLLHDNFKTNINEHMKLTSQLLHKYIAACKVMSNPKYSEKDRKKIKPKHDPFLLKLQLDLQLKRQIEEENYLREAFINLQSSGMKLEKIVYSKIQHILNSYSSLIGSEASLMMKILCQELQKGICSNPPAIDWDQFVACHMKCLMNWKSNDPIPPPRSFSDIEYPRINTPVGKCIKSGYLKFKKKGAKSHETGYFLLTANYLHEFKNSNLYKSSQMTQQDNLTLQQQHLMQQHQQNQHRQSAKANQLEKSSISKHYNHNAQKKRKTLTPNFSILLDDCEVVEATEKKLILKATSVSSEPPQFMPHHYQQNKNVALATTKATAKTVIDIPNKLQHEAQKAKSASSHGFKSFFKSGHGFHSSHRTKEQAARTPPPEKPVQRSPYVQQYNETEPVLWELTLENNEPTESELKYFKKWVNDIKFLTSFDNIGQRAKFIEENMIKNRSHVNLLNQMHGGSQENIPTISNFTQSSLSLLDHNSIAQRSRITSPMLDDKGNLITAFKPQGGRNSPPVFNTAPTRVKSENFGGLQTIPSAQSQNLSMLTPKTQSSDESSGGYFAIPIRKHNSASNPTSPQYQDSLSDQRQISASSSAVDVNASKNVGDPQRVVTPNQTQVPQVNVNDQAVMIRPTMGPKTVSASSVPLSSDSHSMSNVSLSNMSTKSNSTGHARSLYNVQNHSATNLSSTPAVTSRVQPLRSHKKAVSFSSLSSLKFSKRASSQNFSNGHMLNDGIQEHEDSEPHVPGKVLKLNQSLYS